jgi:hypothetical protein
MKIKGQIQFQKLIKSEIDYYLENCNFTEAGAPSEKYCFIMRCKGYSPLYIATETSVSVDTVFRTLRNVRAKINKVILLKSN